MKLKTYNAANSKAIPTGEITLRVNKSAGLLAFSKSATDYFKINAGDKISIVNDEESPTDWYFNISKEGDGFKVRIADGAASFNCTAVAKVLLDSLKINKAAGFKLAKQPQTIDEVDYYAILTSSPLSPK